MRVARLLLVEFALLTIGFAMMSRAGNVPPFLIGCFINQFGAGMLLPTLLVWAMDRLGFEIRARAAGMWTAAFSVGQFLCPVVVTFASDHTSGLSGARGVLSAAAGIGAAGALLALGRKGAPVAGSAGVSFHV